MMGIGVIIVIIMTGLVGELINRNVEDKKLIILEDYGSYIQNEFLLAADVSSGYSRSFFIEDKIEGVAFSISNTDRILIINNSRNEFDYIIPITAGSIKKGENTIQNINGTVCINC